MDRWESSIEDYQKTQTLDGMSSVLRTAKSILKEDLAPFEFDWFIQTLLSEPVFLLDTISARLSDDAWSKAVKDAYDLLSDLVETHYDGIQQYINAIVSECQRAQDPRTRGRALNCLKSCVKHSLSGANASQYTTDLVPTSTCKAPLALLVGTICEYHPEKVSNQINTIWRNYLNMLTVNKNSDLVNKSLLKGVWGLFKHFGDKIHTRELNEFYEKLTKEFLGKCEDAVLPILRDYASLFKEKLASDAALRRELWTYIDLSALLPVYEQAASVLNTEQIQIIINNELARRTNESYDKLRFTALRVCLSLKRSYGVNIDSVIHLDVYALEFALRSETTYDVAEAVSLCIEFNLVNSEKLLQTAIMFNQNLPATKRKDVVVNGLLNAPTDVMNTTLNFLITETCQDEATLLNFLPLWRDLFDSQLVDKKRILFDKYIDNILIVIENFLEETIEDKKLPEKLAALLTLTSHVLTLQQAEDTSDQCALVSLKLVELACQCGLEASLVAVARSLLPHLEDDDNVKKIYEMIQIDKCKDEGLLCESCLALIQAPVITHSTVLLKALLVIFSRKDAEPKTLSLAIHKFEQVLIKENDNLDECYVAKSIKLIEKLRSRKDMVGKDARILQRDVTIFMGKYSYLDGVDDAVSSQDNTLIMRLKDKLSLDVPNPIEGTTYKINLHRLLHLAVVNENVESLRMLLNIICANLCANNLPQSMELLQQALGRVLAALCRATVGESQPKVARPAAVAFCNVDATLYLMQQISNENSPAVRRMLSDMIEGILLKEPGSEANETLLKAVYKEVCVMMKRTNSILKLGGLDITESLLSALKVNRHEAKDMLPNLMILISKTNEQDSIRVFENASQMFIENIGIFSAAVLDNTITELLKITINPEDKITDDTKAKVYRNTLKMTLNFVKKVIEFTNEGSSKISSLIFDLQNSDSVKFVYLWSEMPNFFDLKDDEIKEIMDFENCAVLEKVFNGNVCDSFELEAHLRFFNQYASVLLKFYSEATIKHIGGIIEKLPPKYVKSHRTHLSKCLTHCRNILHDIPNPLLKSFENWSETLSLKETTEYIKKEKFMSNHALSINALDIMLDIFNLKDPTALLTTVSIYAKTWSKTLLKIYANCDMKYPKNQVPYLSDLLSVSLRFLTVTDVKNILLEGHELKGVQNERIGIEFGRFFMPVFVKYLLEKPFIMLQDDMESCWVLLNDIVKWSVRKRWRDEQLTNILQLVDQLWPTYESKASFKAKHSLLLDMSTYTTKLGPDSRPMRWAAALIRSEDTPREDKIALVGLLPGGEEYSETYRHYASLLPTRLSDMDGPSRGSLRALLDALAGRPDKTLLEIVITLSNGDETAGWWDSALDSCMASLARSELTLATLRYVYSEFGCQRLLVPLLRYVSPGDETAGWWDSALDSCMASLARSELTLATLRYVYSEFGCQRLLVPLLRYAPSSLSEQFFASILKELLEGLSSGIKAPSLHPQYRTCVHEKTMLVNILLVLLEKVPASKLESPSSSLYQHVTTDKPWHVPRTVLLVCYKLRDKLITPEGASGALFRLCREFQQSVYNCMCACVCVRRPEANTYNVVFDIRVWEYIVDESIVYDLPLKTEWNQRKIVSAVSIPASRAALSRQSRSASRSRVFLRTLSENPLEYDLIDHQDDDFQNDVQDVELTDNSLNKHPCAATLTTLLQHTTDLDHYSWRNALCDALLTGKTNVRWLLSETICNCREELKSHAKELRPALLAVVADTSQGGLNSLHIDILNTLILWNSDIYVSTSATSHLNTAVNALVQTALTHGARSSSNLFRMLEDVLENTLKVYGSYIQGDLTVFERSLDDANRTKACLKLMLHFAKNNIKIPASLPLLLTKLATNHTDVSILAELIGLEIANSDEDEKATAVAKLKKVLEKIRNDNKISDYVKIMHYSKCCDSQQFRIIVDITLKLPEADKKKCLRIISTYILEHPDEAAEVPLNIQQMAAAMYGDKNFEELFTTTSQFIKPTVSKRAKLDVSSPILNTIGRNEKYINEVLTSLGKERVGRVTQKLCTDNMAVRFVECFYLAIYLPVKYPCGDKAELSVCMASFLQMLFAHLKTQDNFKDKKLRDEPWTINHPTGLTKSRTKRIVGTLRSFAYNTMNRHNNYETETDSEIDVQVSIESILDTFIQFAKVTPEAAMELLTQLLRCVGGRGFDARLALAPLLSTSITAAPELVILARECIDQLYLVDGFMQTVDDLKKSTIGSEGEKDYRLLHEEIELRSGKPDLFLMGTFEKDEVEAMSEDAEFSIEGLVSAFQKLSNWNELTIQEKRRVEAELPVLWTGRDPFKELLEEYTDTHGWFGQMVQLYRENTKDLMKWLRILDKWPRRHYLVSSVIEAMQWHSSSHNDFDIDKLQLPCDIQKSDCLAEWAARLMLRTAYLTEKSDSAATYKLSRSHELLWCKSANERGLHNLAESVIKRNYLDFEDDETLAWMEQKMLASTAMGLKRNDSSELEKALENAKFLPDLCIHATSEVIVGVNKLIMQLNYKLESLSPSKIEDIMKMVETQVRQLNKRDANSVKNKKNLTDFYETAVLYYDGLWNNDELSNDDILCKLSDNLGRLHESELDGAGVAAIILNRLDECGAIRDSTAVQILAKMKPVISELPSCYLEQLKAKRSLFPPHIVRASGIAELQGEAALDKLRQCLQLLCHADYLVLQYCEELYTALLSGDSSKWDVIFDRMTRRVFENEFAGTDYQALVQYQKTFNNIRSADPEMKRIVLKGIMQDLKQKPPRETIRLSHVCPSLVGTDSQLDLAKLLRLAPGVEVLNIQEELRVFTDSVRRPCILSVLTSAGRRRYLLKNEDVRADAAVRLRTDRGYTVIPLSEDCGLIEFLEDHKRIRELITSTCNIDEIPIKRQAAKDEELILAPRSASVQNYNEICSKIPAYSLRSAIENHSSSVQDFISKKGRFLETLSDMTIENWLFGLGDRHLQNVLYSVQDGGVQCIDYGAILQYGSAELPPARLTRSMLAVCDTAVLESKLQNKLSLLRDSRKMIVPTLKLSFKWMENFNEKLVYIEGILQGKMASCDITKDVLQKTERAHKMKYIQLLDSVFSEREPNEIYSIEEQVSSLLLQCTDPWILSVTRSGWEPWL